LQVDITLWRPDDKTTPVLLDGRNRMDALALIGRLVLNAAGDLCIKYPDNSLVEVAGSPKFPVMTDGDPETLVYTLNLYRRHLTPEKKRELIAGLIKAQPEKSNLQIAKQAKADDKTVAKVRREMEARSEIPNVETTVDTKGRKQPAKKTTARKQSAKKKTAKPKRSASQDQRELEAKQAHIDELDAAREHDRDLAERLRTAEMKIVGLESEVEELKAQNAKLREQLEAAQKVAGS
jgi:hypothetical protein